MALGRLDDFDFWRSNPDRHYRCRPATAAEIDAHDWLDPARLPADCFYYAVIHAWHEDAQAKTSTIFVVMEPRGEMNEAQCMRLYRSCNARIRDANDHAQGVV
jgi:hypothetical protein